MTAQNDAPKESITIVGISKVDGGYRIYDQAEREHFVADDAALGALIGSLCADPNAPKAQSIKPTEAKLRDVAVKIATRMLPGYEELSEPAVDALSAFGKFLVRKWKEPRSAAPNRRARPVRTRRSPPDPRTA